MHMQGKVGVQGCNKILDEKKNISRRIIISFAITSTIKILSTLLSSARHETKVGPWNSAAKMGGGQLLNSIR